MGPVREEWRSDPTRARQSNSQFVSMARHGGGHLVCLNGLLPPCGYLQGFSYGCHEGGSSQDPSARGYRFAEQPLSLLLSIVGIVILMLLPVLTPPLAGIACPASNIGCCI